MNKFFVSKKASRALGIIDKGFPYVGAHSSGRVCGASHRTSSSATPPLTGSVDHSGCQGLGAMGSPLKGSGISGSAIALSSDANIIYPNYDNMDGDNVFSSKETPDDAMAPVGTPDDTKAVLHSGGDVPLTIPINCQFSCSVGKRSSQE